ncbi:DUF4389 domain-containing protein [Pseudomonas sp. MAP12]|uniref:DUF4389 domain-containing protein n=1 Tax=Geopseudomonas aromaticivorans TaxID=2849492 RepID=A0ABS6MW66_9GAMM|nr:DUF4389 domain-containing protein [Pseudomonas aromaticivorans]
MSYCKQNNCEGLILRIVWMALFVLVWQVAELVLLAVVVVQLVYRLFKGRPNVDVMNFGDSLSQYLAQIGRFGSFHSDEKPWPFTDWPTPREPQGEGAEAVRAAGEAAAAASSSPVAQAASAEPAPAAETAAAQAQDEPAAQPESAASGESEPVAESEVKPEATPDAPAEPKA